MDKTANQILELVADRLMKYAPQAVVVGGGIAGLSHLIAMKKQHDKEQASMNKEDNTIYLDIPKTAFDWNRAADVAGAAAGGAVVGAGIGTTTYLVANLIRKIRDKKPLIESEEGLYGDEEISTEDKYASIWDTPASSQYLLDSGLAVGTTLAGGALGYKVVNSILQNVRKRKAQSELESTKDEYSKLLSQKIYGMENKKTASDVAFPEVEALALAIYNGTQKEENKLAFDKEALSDPTMMSMFTSLPGVGALITGILAHNYWYNKQKDIEAGLAKTESEKVKKTPAMIKIRTTEPQPVDVPKTASLLNSGVLDTASTVSTISEWMNKEPKKEPLVAPKEPVFENKDVETIDPNTVVVSTDDGDTQIDATDPAAVALLEKYKHVIAKSIATGVNLNNAPSPKE